MEIHRALHQRVRTDNHVNIARRQPGEQIATTHTGRGPSQQLDAEA